MKYVPNRAAILGSSNNKVLLFEAVMNRIFTFFNKA